MPTTTRKNNKPQVIKVGPNEMGKLPPQAIELEDSVLGALMIEKEAYASVENGAYLGKHSHELLHHIEIFDKDLYDAWNYIFLVINKMKCYPIPVVWDIIHDLQRQTEELFQKDSKTLRKLRKETAKRKEC